MSRKVTVTQDAIIKRINRKLAHEGERLVTLRGERGVHDLGRHYIVDTHQNGIVATHVDIVDLAREMKVIHAIETVET